MGALEGRVAIITGAGRGIGREHALLFAAEGAKVVVNDLGGAIDGSGDDRSRPSRWSTRSAPFGGEAMANGDDVADWEGGQHLDRRRRRGVRRPARAGQQRRDPAGQDARQHVRGGVGLGHPRPPEGSFRPHPARRGATGASRSRTGSEVKASVVNTSSTSGLLGNPGQTNYGAAKAGIAAFTVIAAQELVRYGVRVNAIAPAARTRMTEQTPGLGDIVKAPTDPASFDVWNPANVSPLVAYLATECCPLTGKVLFVQGGQVRVFQPWTMTDTLEKDDRWTVDELAEQLPGVVGVDAPG